MGARNFNFWVFRCYTTNPHERSASNGPASCLPSDHRAPTERPRSKLARQLLGGHSAIACQALVGISGVEYINISNSIDSLVSPYSSQFYPIEENTSVVNLDSRVQGPAGPGWTRKSESTSKDSPVPS